MDGRDGVHNLPRLVFGLMVIVIGLVFTLDRLGVLDAGHLLDYWPALLIAWGLTRVLQGPHCRGFWFGFVAIFVGAWLLFENLGLIYYHLWSFWPLLLVVLGLAMVLRAVGARSPSPIPVECECAPPPHPSSLASEAEPPVQPAAGEASGPNDRVSAFAMFGGAVRRSASKSFRGGDLTAIMGGCELDLSHATPVPEGAVIDVLALMGGVEITVPSNWQVIMEGVPIFGGFEDKTNHGNLDGRSRLTVRGTALMGGIEVHN